MKKAKLLIIGAGGHGRSVAEAAELTGLFELVGFLDDAYKVGELAIGCPVVGSIDSLPDHRIKCDGLIVALGNNVVREKIALEAEAAGFRALTVIHPRAFVSPSAIVARGAAIMAGAVIGTEANIGRSVIVNCGAVVDHHACVDDFGHLGVSASMAGGSVLGRGSFMQAGSALGYGVVVPAKTILAPGRALSI